MKENQIPIVEIPLDFLQQFQNATDDACRDIGGWPSVSVTHLFSDRQKVIDCIDKSYINPLDERSLTLADWFKPEPINYYMHLDGSQGGDGFGLALSHLLKMEDLPFVKVDLLGSPNKKTYGKDFKPEIVQDLISILLDRGFNIRICTYDRATDISAIKQLMEPYGSIVEPMSIDRCTSYPIYDIDKPEPPFFKRKNTQGYYDKPMTELRDLINSGRLSVPYHPKWFDLPFTFEHDLAKRQIKKIANKLDDLGQSVAGSVFHVLNNEKQEIKTDNSWQIKEKPDTFLLELKQLQDQSDRRAEQLNSKNFDKVPDEYEVEDSYEYGNSYGNRYYL